MADRRSRRGFVAAGRLGLASLVGGCAIGLGSVSTPKPDFTVQNVTGSTAVVRFDLGVQSSTEAGLIERTRGSDLRLESGQTMGHSPARSRITDMRRLAGETSGSLLWQVEIRVLGSSWEEPLVNWFELRDGGPTTLSLHTGFDDETGERTVVMKGAGRLIEAIPQQHWPRTDGSD